MKRQHVQLALGVVVLALIVNGCAWLQPQSGSAELQPFLTDVPSTEAVTLTEPLPVGLIWLKPSEGSVQLPERAEQMALDTIRSHFAGEGKRLSVVRVDTVTSVDLPSLRQLGQAHGVKQFLLLAPSVREIEVPARLLYGRAGSGVGTRTESWVLLEAVGVALDSGSSLFAARGNAAAMLEELDYGPLGPWYPRIGRGIDLAGSGGFIFPNGEVFQPGEVRAVALKDALAILLAELDRLQSSNAS